MLVLGHCALAGKTVNPTPNIAAANKMQRHHFPSCFERPSIAPSMRHLPYVPLAKSSHRCSPSGKLKARVSGTFPSNGRPPHAAENSAAHTTRKVCLNSEASVANHPAGVRPSSQFQARAHWHSAHSARATSGSHSNVSSLTWSCTIAGFDGSNLLIGFRSDLGMVSHALH